MEDNLSRKRGRLEDGGSETETETKTEFDGNAVGSEEMELRISIIVEKMDRFTTLVSDLLDSGKAVFKELSNEFEERMITVHKEQVGKWQEEIKQLRKLDASNEQSGALLHNARYLLQSAQVD